MPAIVVHHLDNSRSQRVLWLLEELELPYTLEQWKRGADMRAPAGLREIHPLGFAPIVTVDDTVLVESGAILESLLDRFGEGRLRPAGGPQLDAFRFWLHYAEGSLMPPLLVKLITGRLRTAAPFFLKPLTSTIANTIDGNYTDPQIARHMDWIESHLAEREWLLDDFSAADVQMGFPLEAALSRGGTKPNIQAWVERCRARPAYIRALEKGGPFTL
jgi:glutathione S-transferase